MVKIALKSQSVSTIWRRYIERKASMPQAEPLFLRSLAILEQVLGTHHPAVATSLNNLAALYADQGQYDQAEPLLLRAIAIAEQMLGVDHPNTKLYRENYERHQQERISQESSPKTTSQISLRLVLAALVNAIKNVVGRFKSKS